MTDLETFRAETREWLAENCPPEMCNLSFHWEDAHLIYQRPEAKVWLERMAAKGWVVQVFGTSGYSNIHAVFVTAYCME